jgi:hypothetical protein
MSDSDFQMTREELQELHDQFREFKHGLNNTLAVIMALAELAQRNPAHYEKLGSAILTRGPLVVEQLNTFQNSIAAKLKPAAAETSVETTSA